MAVFFITIKKQITYRGNIIFGMITTLFAIFIQIALWNYIYFGNKDMRNSMVGYVMLSTIISLCYSNSVSSNIAQKVREGTFSNDLLRPINYIKFNYYIVLGEVVSNLLIRGLPLLLFMIPIAFVYNIKFNNVGMIALMIIAIILGHILFFLIYAIIGFLAFIFHEIWAFNSLMDDTIRLFSGAVIPISFFPETLSKIVNFLPLKYLYSFPIELGIFCIDTREILINFTILVTWIAVVSILLFICSRFAIKKCTVQGG